MKSLVATLLVAALAATGKATSADELYSGLWLRPPVQVMRGYPGLCYSLCYNEIKQSDPNCSCQADFIIERIICAGIGSTTDEGYVGRTYFYTNTYNTSIETLHKDFRIENT